MDVKQRIAELRGFGGSADKQHATSGGQRRECLNGLAVFGKIRHARYASLTFTLTGDFRQAPARQFEDAPHRHPALDLI